MSENEQSPINYENNTELTDLKPYLEPVNGVKGAFLIYNVLTGEECAQFIDVTEKIGYTEALISTANNSIVGLRMPEVRDNKRVIWDVNNSVLDPIWARIYKLLPQELFSGAWKVFGLNEKLRFYRYDPGESFKPHYDGNFKRTKTEQSHLTFIIYLNDDYKGGATTFYINDKKIFITPRRGMALCFMHTGPDSPLHEGPTPLRGRKYVFRSDIMYRHVNYK